MGQDARQEDGQMAGQEAELKSAFTKKSGQDGQLKIVRSTDRRGVIMRGGQETE